MKTKSSPGIKTTEFYALIALYASQFLTLLVGVDLIPTEIAEELKASIVNFAQLSTAIGTAAYIVFRSALKAVAEIKGNDSGNVM